MKAFIVRINGISPMLQHRPTEEGLGGDGNGTRRVKLDTTITPREVAAKAVYQAKDGSFYFPSGAIARLLREAGSNHKQRGNRKSMKYVIPGAVFQTAEAIPLLTELGQPIMDFDIDSRPVTIPSTKGVVMRHRARFERWAAQFTLEIDDATIPPEFILQLLTEGGRAIGIGDFRPERGGPFGRFQVTSWEPL